MSRSYQSLSGEEIIKKIRSKNRRTVLLCALGDLAVVGAAAVLLFMTANEHRYVYAIIGLLVCVLFFVALTTVMKAALTTLKDVANAKLFRKFGAPERLAEAISAGAEHPLLESRQTLAADSFIMKHNDFESYVPYSAVLLCYKKEQRTNGILTSVSLVVHDAYGDKTEYPFKMGKRHEGEMNDVMRQIAEQAPNAAFGYTPQNLKYAAANARRIPE